MRSTLLHHYCTYCMFVIAVAYKRMTETSNEDVLKHIIDLSHLITDNETSSWEAFKFVGLGQDGKIYLAAFKESMPEIGIFSGSPLLPNSWKLISR